MSKRTRTLLKSWFENGDIPNQNQFWDWIDSFFHLDDGVIVKSIQPAGVGKKRITFSDNQTVTTLEDNATPEITQIGKWMVYKKPGNIDYENVEDNDVIEGWFDATRFGKYYVNDASDLTIKANLTNLGETEF